MPVSQTLGELSVQHGDMLHLEYGDDVVLPLEGGPKVIKDGQIQQGENEHNLRGRPYAITSPCACS